MKYLITEERLKNIVIQYLDSINWVVKETPENFGHKEIIKYPYSIYEHKDDEHPAFIIQQMGHRYGISRILLINNHILDRLGNMFGYDVVGDGPEGEPNTLIMDWYNSRFEPTVEDYLWIDSL